MARSEAAGVNVAATGYDVTDSDRSSSRVRSGGCGWKRRGERKRCDTGGVEEYVKTA
jgi:hypothetical protein